jgi:hypothetical protein
MPTSPRRWRGETTAGEAVRCRSIRTRTGDPFITSLSPCFPRIRLCTGLRRTLCRTDGGGYSASVPRCRNERVSRPSDAGTTVGHPATRNWDARAGTRGPRAMGARARAMIALRRRAWETRRHLRTFQRMAAGRRRARLGLTGPTTVRRPSPK